MSFKKPSKLMRASEWSEREFAANSAPQNRTIKGWILRGVIRGLIVDNKVYVYEYQHFGVAPAVSSAVSDLIAASR
ncbi:hypothetical protein [Shewanella scandinavica]|uniref:hypothetical protein n=1 Tax=Shewanella scandinavica TaxID=3063538 RepID=UPI0031949C8D